jgi:hypothetical protein
MFDTNNCLQELNGKPNKPQGGEPISRSRFENLTYKKLGSTQTTTFQGNLMKIAILILFSLSIFRANIGKN